VGETRTTGSTQPSRDVNSARPPRDVNSARPSRDASNLTLSFIIGYVRARGGDEAVESLLQLAGEERPLSELLDQRRWSTQEQKIALFEAGAELLHEPDIGRRVGEAIMEQRTSIPLRVVLRALGSPGALCRSVAKASAKFSTNYTCTALTVERDRAVIRNQMHEGYQPHRIDCDYTSGLLSQIPVVFGLPAASVLHDECQVRGAPACVYHLRWRTRYRLPWRAQRARTADVATQLDLITERYEALQSSVVDLVSPADVDTVLSRITRRAADAVRAQKYLLALVDTDGGVSVHHDGMTQEEAHQLAKDVLVAIPDDRGGMLLIADVASARRSYGRLVAVSNIEHTFFPEERRLLNTYARQAAVALDAANALEEARRKGETASTLLELSRQLAKATSSDEVAQFLAEAVPTVVNAPRASVYLLEPGEYGRLVPRGWAPAYPEQNDARQLTVSHFDTPALARLIATREPQHYLRSTPDEFLRTTLEQAGLEELLVVPIVSDGDVIGAICATRPTDCPPLPDKGILADRMAGLADQASMAFEKVRLLEHERAAVRRLRDDERRIKHLAYHDALTGLPNSRHFTEALDATLARAKEAGDRLALLFVDLDRFKTVNDSLGHSQGDQLLRVAAARLSGCVRECDTLARLGGDEFTLLMGRVETPDEPEAVAGRILAAFAAPFGLDGQEVFLSASVGIAVYPEDGVDSGSLLRNADAAMYGAKVAGRNNLARYAPAMNARARHLLELESDLHAAIGKGELVVYYQPQLEATTSRIVAVEALARWRHPRRGLVLPGEFISLAEESTLIASIDEVVFREACSQAMRWCESGLPELRIGVNLSAQQLRRPGLVTSIAAILRETGINPDRVELELTRTAALTEPERVVDVLSQLRELGLCLAVDDFGTGFSIWGQLKRFPVGRLKIDRSFVAGLPGDRHDAAVVSATIDLAHRVGMEVTAAGVENTAQAAFLTERGCDLLQGFLYAGPQPPEVVAELLRDQAAGAA
jgi:diguanylate cyclase (GGDEF)-like protein